MPVLLTEWEESLARLTAFFLNVTDEERFARTVNNKDWEEIPGVLLGFVKLQAVHGWTSDVGRLFRMIVEIAYCLGYKSGKKAKTMNHLLAQASIIEEE